MTVEDIERLREEAAKESSDATRPLVAAITKVKK